MLGRAAEPAAAASAVKLPDAWNRDGRSGSWVYQLRFDGPPDAQVPWGLYLPRAGNRFAVSINAQRIGQFGSFAGDPADFSQRSHFLFLPPSVLRAGSNDLSIAVDGDLARYAGLSRVHVGPVAEVRPMFLWREVTQTWGSFAIVAISLAFGLISAALAWSQRDHVFAIFAAACAFCALRTSYAIVIDPPFDHGLWQWVVDNSYAGYLVCLCVFSTQSVALRGRWIWWLSSALVVLTLIAVPLNAFGRIASARQVWLLGMVLYALVLCMAVIHAWWRRRDRESAILAGAGAIAVALAVHDHVLIFYTADGYGSFALSRYSLLVFLVAMGWLLVDRFASGIREEAAMRLRVETELIRRRAELEMHFDLQQKLAQAQVQQRERERIVQDVHDGMGLQLNGLLSLVESGSLRREELTREVRTAIDQMRLLVSNTEYFDGDVAMLMGQLRHSIERRLRQAGIALTWNCQLEKPSRQMRPEHAIALQRLVFELTTNVIKHAKAAEVRLSVSDAGGGLSLQFSDSGSGFDPERVVDGQGRRSMRRRADEMGARASLASRPGEGSHYSFECPETVFA